MLLNPINAEILNNKVPTPKKVPVTFEAHGVKIVDNYYEITTVVETFEVVRKALEDAGITLEIAEIARIPSNTVAVDEKKGKALLKLMDILDDHADIQKAYSNFDISDDVMNAILEDN